MRLIFIRHGHPDYKKDCLTELGHKHAQAMVKRLSDEKIDRIYSSSCGRAVETAQHLADARGMNVTLCDFMREVKWGSVNGEELPHDGYPWSVIEDMIADGVSLMNENWENSKYFCNNTFPSYLDCIKNGFDDLLEDLGYKREGHFYRVVKSNPENVVMVSHGGSSSTVISHIFNMSLPFVYSSFRTLFTGITIVTFNGEESSLISPKFELANDTRHIASIENVFGN